MRQWWIGLSQRERVMLGALALLFLLLTAWYGVWRPVAQFHRAAMAGHALALEEQQRVQALLARIKTAAARPQQDISVPEAVRQSLENAGIGGARFESDPGGGVRVAIGGIPSSMLFPWIAELQGRHGVTPRHLVVVKAGQGLLQLDATFARDGS